MKKFNHYLTWYFDQSNLRKESPKFIQIKNKPLIFHFLSHWSTKERSERAQHFPNKRKEKETPRMGVEWRGRKWGVVSGNGQDTAEVLNKINPPLPCHICQNVSDYICSDPLVYSGQGFAIFFNWQIILTEIIK